MSSNSEISDAPLHLLVPITLEFITSRARKKVIKQHNLKVNYGRFTKEEDTLLKQNFDKFCDEFNANDDMKNRLLGFFANSSNYTTQQKKEIKMFIRKEKFWLRMANGLPHRTLYSVLNRCRKRCSLLKKRSQFTSDDKNKIVVLKRVWGEKWIKIAERVKCNPFDVCSFIRDTFNKDGLPHKTGHWSARESKRLIKALKKYLQTDDLSDKIFTKSIPWIKVRDEAKINRSSNHCLDHWSKTLRWKVANFDKMENWSKRDSAKLIYVLFKCDYDNECDIDWDYIKLKFANITSFNNLCKNWQIIKTTVPEFHIKTYKQIINFLYDKFLPNIIKTDEDLKALEDFYNS